MKVFISSTARDLSRHRSAVASALERLGLQVARMETFGARHYNSNDYHDEISDRLNFALHFNLHAVAHRQLS